MPDWTATLNEDILSGMFLRHISFTIQTFQPVGPFDPHLINVQDNEFGYRALPGVVILNCPRLGYHNHTASLGTPPAVIPQLAVVPGYMHYTRR
jgi:hypothetical protein